MSYPRITNLQITFRSTLRWGLGFVLICSLLGAVLTLVTLRSVTSTQSHLLVEHSSDLIEAEGLRAASETVVASSRGFLIFGDQKSFERMGRAVDDFDHRLIHLRDELKTDEGRSLLDSIVSKNGITREAATRVIEKRRRGVPIDVIEMEYEREVQPKREEMHRLLSEFSAHKRDLLEKAREEAAQMVSRARRFIVITSLVGLAMMLGGSVQLGRLLLRRYQEAQDAVQSRDEVVSILSHDLRNPLGAILLSQQLIPRLADQGKMPEVKKACDQIKTAADQMHSLVKQLLDLSKIQGGQILGDRTQVPVGQLLEEALLANAPLAHARGIQIQVEVQDKDLVAYCDRERLFQVLMNLIGNSLKFTHEGGTIRLTGREVERNVEIAVIDTGAGIPVEDIPHIFDRFWQAKKARRAGAGLGLSIVKGIVEAHGGTIQVRSAPGQGSEFAFRVPAPSA